MRGSVNISKIVPPHLPQIIDRPRLLNLLEKNQEKRLILILGQAAQGKSTLATSYVKRSKIPSAWINLDREDSDPASLFYLITYSLQHVLKDVNLDNLLFYPMGPVEPRSESPLFREWSLSLFEQISSPVHVVMDGLDRLSPDTLAFHFLQTLIEHSPLNVRFIALSREIPPLFFEFQNLKMRQEAFILTNKDLAFTKEEIRTFFHEIRKILFNADQVKKISLATEGWIGGLILLSEFLDRFPEVAIEKFVSEELPDLFKEEVFQYFSKEIFSSEPKQIQEFLVRSSILELIDPGFMKDFTGIENAEEILREHVRRNLFVQSFYDERKGWLFKYHQLFRDFLKAKFMSQFDDQERQALLIKAGDLYEQRGELENSVRYFLEAKAYPQASSVVERLGMDLLRVGRKEHLLEWLRILPEDFMKSNPWLLFYLAMTRRFVAGGENVVAFEKAYRLFREKGDEKGKLLSIAYLIEASIHTGIHLVPMERLIDEGETLLQSTESDKYEYERAVLLYCSGLGHIFGAGDIRKGIWACQNAYVLSSQARDVSLQAYALNFSAFGYVFLGEFSSADDINKKAQKIIERSVFPELKAAQLMLECILANHRGDFDKAKGFVEKLQVEIESHGFFHIVPWTYEILAYLQVAQGEFSEAERIGTQYLQTANSLNNAFFKGLAHRLLGLIYFHKDDFQKAKEAIGRSVEIFSKIAPSRYHLNRDRIEMGLICTHLKEYARAEKELGAALQYFSSISSSISVAEVHLAIAFLQCDQGKNEHAASHLQSAFKIAEQKGYEYFYNLGTKYLMKTCLLALDLSVEGVIDYAAHLLLTRPFPMAEKELESLSNHPDRRIREKSWEIRRRIHRSKVPRLSIETLGGFRVFRGDSLIQDEEWDRVQPKQLLKLMITRGSPTIPKETLIEDLWPEERPDAAEKHFKTALQRLRRSLEPVIHKDFGSSYVHLNDNCVILDRDLCVVDAALFLSLIKRGEEKQKSGDIKGALLVYTEAMVLYKGDFLPEEVHLPEADRKREELKGIYIDLLQRLANLHEKQGASRKAIDCHKKAIQADPLLEASYQKLMTLYFNKGMQNEALKLYEACRKLLKTELKTKPDPMTTALYEKILEKINSS